MFLTDGGQTAESVAGLLAEFIAAAAATLDIAIYDLRLDAAPASTLLDAVATAKARGVRIRILFNQDHPKRAVDPPPNQIDWDLVKRMGVEWHPIPGVPDLMHHKYIARDAGTAAAAVWTGTSNWTNDSWTREENILVRISSPPLTALYAENFAELLSRREVSASGHQASTWLQVEGVQLRAFFTPGRAMRLVHEIAQRLGHAQRRVRICSPVITSGPILGTLAEVVRRPGLDIKGCYDGTQMDAVLHQWAAGPASWKIAAFQSIIAAVPFGAKRSTPWQTGSVHDFMHAKTTVVDDTVFVGSYNLSHSGEENAENVLEIQDAALADQYSDFIERVAARYPVAPATPA